MTNVLLFKNNNAIGSEKLDERIELFGETLNHVFEQFQKLWDDYKELIKRCKESEDGSANTLHKLQNIPKDDNAECCRCAGRSKLDLVSEKEPMAVREKKKVGCDPSAVTTSEIEAPTIPEYDPTFQIFTEDFYSQGLEESFINQSKTPLQEIQNIDPKRAKSPIFGSKKTKTLATSSPSSSPNVSQKSVVILKDFTDKTDSKVESRSTSNISNSEVVATALSSPDQLSSQVSELGTTPAEKNVRKWGISTTHNVNTDIIIGTNKKLRQTKLYMKTEKVTDLSHCDDVFGNKSDDRDPTTRTRDSINDNCTQTNGSCFDDSLIQASPEHETALAKKRQKIARRIKSAPTLEQKFNMDKDTLTNITPAEKRPCNDIDDGQTDTDLTIFEPKLASTQYSHPPCRSKALGKVEKSKIKDKLHLRKKIDHENNDSKINDETLFEENVIPSFNWAEKNLKSEKGGRQKKLSTKKVSNVSKTPVAVLSDLEISIPEGYESLDTPSPEELRRESPPRKREKLTTSVFALPTKKKNTSPTYVYKGSPVRKKAERALLNGWSCLKCQKYYEATDLTGDELQKRKNICSRHRSKFNEKKATQGDYWDPDFSSSLHSTMWSDD